MSATAGQPQEWTLVAETDVHGEHLAVHACGEPGLPVMALLHGMEDSWASWQGVADELAGQFQFFAVDLPWRPAGTFAWRTGATAATWVSDALALIPARPSVVTAHSLGATSTLRWMAEQETIDLAAIVLLSPFYRPPSVPVDWNIFEKTRHDFRLALTGGLRSKLGSRADSIDPDVFESMANMTVQRAGPQGFIAMFDQVVMASNLSLQHIRTPTLIIAGEYDPGIKGERAAALAADIPIADFRLYSDISHFCHIEQAWQVATMMRDFFVPLAGRLDPGTNTSAKG